LFDLGAPELLMLALIAFAVLAAIIGAAVAIGIAISITSARRRG